MKKDVMYFVSLCEKGVITHCDLFAGIRESGLAHKLPERLKKDFEEWDKAHPESECLTFCIFA